MGPASGQDEVASGRGRLQGDERGQCQYFDPRSVPARHIARMSAADRLLRQRRFADRD